MAWLYAILICLPLTVFAAPWNFQKPVTVSSSGDGVFHHLGAGGRSGIGVSGGLVSVTWEDNRNGEAACYVALLEPKSGKILKEHRVSGKGNAYEPAVIGIGGQQFAVAWEQDAHVWLRLFGPDALGEAIRVDLDTGAHASLTRHGKEGLVVVWSEQGQRIWLADIELPPEPKAVPRVLRRTPVEPAPLRGSQTYPSVISTPAGQLTIGWEDRRKGYTAIFVSTRSKDGSYLPPIQINESFWGGKKLGYGRGTGAMRVMLAKSENETVAVWADKRNFRSGYDVYAAFATGDNSRFGKNQKVQDAFAENAAQWHPGVAMDGELIVVAWDDDRDGTDDIWLSWREDSAWSDDLGVPGASGDGYQSEPALTLDQNGSLHLAWVRKGQQDGSSSQIRYLYAPRSE